VVEFGCSTGICNKKYKNTNIRRPITVAKRTFDPDAAFQGLRAASRITGLSQGFLREGCKNGTIPHIRVGQEYKINLPLLVRLLDGESLENLKTEVCMK
jgi:hypothetical protein